MIVVDLFGGASGASTGAVQAGCKVAWAGNHWPLAVATHELNHPTTHHVCQDLRQADWSGLPPYDLLWASPACQGHSSAARPVPIAKHDADRNSAWAVVECAQVTRPRLLVVENVPDFAGWILYANWRACLETLGYRLQTHLLSATAFGVPQRRTRLVIVGSRAPLSLRFPTAPDVEPAFGPFLERRLPWRPFSQAKPGARARMLNALQRQGNRRCLVQHVTGHPGVPLHESIRTITTKRQWVLADPDRGYRWLTTRELARAQGFPESFRLPAGTTATDGARLIGNAVPPPLAGGVIAAVREAA